MAFHAGRNPACSRIKSCGRVLFSIGQGMIEDMMAGDATIYNVTLPL